MKHLTILLAAAALIVAAPPSLSSAGDGAGGSCGACPMSKPAGKDIVDTAVAAGSFDTLVAAAKAAGLVDTLKGAGPFTVFAPSDEAFAKLPAGTVEGLLKDKAALTEILTYHVVAGKVPASAAMNLDWAPSVQGQSIRVTTRDGSVFVDDARVVTADVKASNGVIHVIDRVILPRKDIVETAVSAGSFDTLVAAVKAAGLVETLQGEGPFTVFAPADAAFAKLPAGAVADLLKNKTALTGVLTYHVVAGRVLGKDLAIGTTEVKTLQGGHILVTKTRDGRVTVDGANVTSADVLAGNGVIHVLDAVIMPKQQ